MNEKKYSWTSSVVSAAGYPAEVHVGHLSSGKVYLATLPKTGTLNDGWDQGTPMMSGGSGIPTELSLTWVSYVDKKFWKVDVSLDSNKILWLFEQGIDNFDGYHEKLIHEQYNGVVVAVAPGGMVAVFITGPRRRVEVGYYQAKETFVDINNFYDNPREDTQQQFFDRWFNHLVPDTTKEIIRNKGIPYKLWDINRQKYNWRFLVELYDHEDNESRRSCIYLNGEEDQKFDSTLYAFEEKPLPWRVRFAFNTSKKWAETEFDSSELRSIFREMTRDNPKNDPIEIIGKVTFMYKGMEFRVRCGEKVVPLEHVKVDMWRLLRKRDDDNN